MPLQTPPNQNQVEVTLIGTGGGYGESVILKIGFDSWVIIDSCIDPNSKAPLTIEYLNSISVPFSKVKLILCTHWHNDHILGLSKVLEKCENAEFSFSSVHDLDKFLLLCGLDEKKANKGSISSTNEFIKCFKILNSRLNPYYTFAQSDTILLSETANNTKFELIALSPSPQSIVNFFSEVSTLITEFGVRNTPIKNRTPNDKSVALLLKFGDNRVILGADLEVGRNNTEGWRHVIDKSKVIDNLKATLYKIPHHGSENGYIPEIFDKLIDNNVVLKLTPFKSNNLPQNKMLDTYIKHSEKLYLTSSTLVSSKPKKRDRSIDKIIKFAGVELSEVKFIQGIVRSRIDYALVSSDWETEVFDAAFLHKQII